jgi:hypothetical protein
MRKVANDIGHGFYGVECITTHLHGFGRGVSRWMQSDGSRCEWETLEQVDAYLAEMDAKRGVRAASAYYVARQIGPDGEMLQIDRSAL